MAWEIRIVAFVILGGWLAIAPVKAQEDTELRMAEQLGASLYQIDRALQVAASEGERSRAFRRDQRVQSRVADLRPDAIQVTYVGSEDGAPVALYRVTVDYSGKVLVPLERLDPVPLDGQLAVQHAIVRKAREAERTECSSAVETLVVPVDGGWRAYVLPRAAFPDVYLLGGSYRVQFSAPGGAMAEVQALASECVILQNKPGSGDLLFAEDRRTVPNELHVYISRLAGKPLYVTTTPNGRTWLIRNGRIQDIPSIPASAG